MAGFVVTKVIREFLPVENDPTVKVTLGDVLNEVIARNLKEGLLVQTVSLELEESEWQRMLAKYGAGNHAYDSDSAIDDGLVKPVSASSKRR